MSLSCSRHLRNRCGAVGWLHPVEATGTPPPVEATPRPSLELPAFISAASISPLLLYNPYISHHPRTRLLAGSTVVSGKSIVHGQRAAGV
jgi:hypothetical protein